MNKIKISRKKFLKWLAALAVLPFIAIWDKQVRQTIRQQSKLNKIEIPSNIPNGVSFHNSIIVNKKDKKVEILSSKCTHLGCKINKIENDRLTCPCHGSQYSIDGKVLKGPATKPLKVLSYKIDPQTNQIVVFDG